MGNLLPAPKLSWAVGGTVMLYCGQPKAHLCNNHAV